MDTAACAFCGAQTATSSMDMTGHGWRCPTCAIKSQVDVYRHGSNDMAEHLTRGELERVVSQGANEAMIGAALAIGAGVLTAASLASGSSIVLVFSGAMVGGCGMLGHGLYRRRQAKAAIAQAPDARVISR